MFSREVSIFHKSVSKDVFIFLFIVSDFILLVFCVSLYFCSVFLAFSCSLGVCYVVLFFLLRLILFLFCFWGNRFVVLLRTLELCSFFLILFWL